MTDDGRRDSLGERQIMLGWRHAGLSEFGAVVHTLTLLAGGLATIAATLVAQDDVRRMAGPFARLVTTLAWSLGGVALGTLTMVARGLAFTSMASILTAVIMEDYSQSGDHLSRSRRYRGLAVGLGIATGAAILVAGAFLIGAVAGLASPPAP